MFKTPLMSEPAKQTDSLFTVTETQLGWTRNKENWRTIPEQQFRALVRVREENNVPIPYVLNIVSGSYKLVQNYDLYNHIEQVMLDNIVNDQLKDVTIKDSASHFGRITFREYRFPRIITKIDRKSDVAFRVIVKNAYGGASLRLIGGAIDFYCSNGMIRGEYESQYHRHSSGLEIEHVGINLKKAIDTYVKDCDLFKDWTKKHITHASAMELFKKIAASPRLIDKFNDTWLQESEDRGQTKWALYSTLTHYASHQDGVFKTRDTNNDTEASTMHKREIDVAKWLKLPEFELV